MELISQIPIALWIAGVLALYMAWAIGANDVANAMGTSVGSGALTVWGAILVAAIFEFAGAFFAGGHVTDTVRKGMLDISLIGRDQLIYGMLGSLAAAGTLLVVATRFGLPVSTTHAIVGAIVGFGVVSIGPEVVNWGKIGQIVLSWLTSPLLAGVIAFGIFQFTRAKVLDTKDPVVQIRKLGPVFFFLVFFIIGLVTLFKGLKPLKLDLNLTQALIGSTLLGFVGSGLGIFFIRRVQLGPEDPKHRFSRVEKIFVVLQILTACAIAFAHGSNDVANAIGPLAAISSAISGADLGGKASVSPWMLAIGGIGIIFGLATWGYRVMETVGKRITELTPSRGFAAQLAAATTIVVASRMGIPISTTHTLVGAVLGVGLARGISALDLRVVGKIIASWVATLPIAAGLSMFFYFFFKGLLAG
ncbi:Probable low-affinity inorganic phosphate transporter [hydrothermal vent metagenome]|jgi:PiT family inorganic phosphate transporter|uniref:Probable low-affinity inorganic phosphate transporter n=1 Tax=hydrothermal vent metagenome TaxID=652676 RepID=A0A170PR21_9ZZZZ|nr:phosphate permease [Acidiferrobacteraceae bacterium]MDK2755059.1 inorganic phosphate transporter [Gammaproteobacteria bacterium]|tara:strand:- start:4297 stop:5550 length:1254 start_codon:yes stop_codon:yes gene_type:complete